MIVTLTEEEAELVILAMEYFRHNGLQDHDTADRVDIINKLEAIAETVRKEKIGEAGILRAAAKYHYAQAACPRDQFGNTSNHRNPTVEAWHRQVADAITATTAPPSAPVGVDLHDRVEFALRDAGFDYDEAARIASIAQQAAAVDGAWLSKARSLYDRCSVYPETNPDGMTALLELRNHVYSILAAQPGGAS